MNKKCIKCNRIGKFEIVGDYLVDKCPKCGQVLKSIKANEKDKEKYQVKDVKELKKDEIPFYDPEGDDE